MSDLSKRIAELSPQKRELLIQQLKKKQNVAQSQIQRQNRDSYVFPLSFAQQRLWFFDQLEPGNPSYNIPAAVRIEGQLNAIALEQSLNYVIQRHEILRTSFTTIDGKPVQVVAPELKITLSAIDLRHLLATEREQAVQKLATKEAQQPFDLRQAPLLRVSLLYLSKFEYVVLFTQHHIISDGWSMEIFIQDTITAYTQITQGKPLQLLELPIQYADFAVWQQQWLTGKVLEAQISYWKKQLGGNLPVLELPTDRLRPTVQTFQGARETFVLPKTLTVQLTQLGKQQDATLFMVLLAAFKTLLYRHTGQEDILVGSPIANRDRTEVEGVIGFFVNTLVLRTCLDGTLSFRQLLKQVKNVALGAYAHQELPFEKLVEELQPERNLSHTPLFQVMFIFQNTPTHKTVEIPELVLHSLDADTATAKFDFTLIMVETAEGLAGTLEYSTDLFEATTIKRLIGHFQTLLAGIVANSEQQLSHLPLLTEPEKHKLLVEWNNTKTEHEQNRCIHQLFEQQVEKTPDAVAVVFNNEQLTYQQLNQQANQLAHHLQKLGIKPETPVGICVERSIAMLVGLLGIIKAGGAYVPLDPAYPKERLAFVIEDAKIRVLLTQKNLMVVLPEHQAQVVCLDSNWEEIAQQSELNPINKATTNNLIYIIYTSGSTGQPKGVQITHGAVANFLNSMCLSPGLSEKDVLLAVTTLSFDIAALEIYLPLIVGARLVMVSREVATDGTQLLAKLTSSGITIMQATPATWRMLLAVGWQGSSQLKILCGGEVLDSSLANQLLERGSEVWNLYGPTETTIWSAVQKVESKTDGIVSIGRPIANTQFYILDQHQQLVPIGVSGELYIGGAGLARGYINRPELTVDKFILNPFEKAGGRGAEVPTALKTQHSQDKRLYKTGDLARYLPDGNIEFLGRIDFQVKVRGFRIELGEIEALLAQHPAVRETVMIASSDSSGNKRLVAYVVPQTEVVEQHDLRCFMQEKLPEHMIPSAFVVLEALPLTPNGKVDRRALPAPEQTQQLLLQTSIPPRTFVEEMVVNIWSKVLSLEHIGINDNFFELGGHSLLATMVIARLREAFGIELPLRCLFEAPTVASLSDYIGRIDQKLQAPPIQRISRNQELPLSFAQQRLWFLDQLQPGNEAYNIPVGVRMHGVLNIEALQQSFQEVINRHEALRTVFTTVAGQPIQEIIESPSLTLPVVDLQHLAPTEREAKALQLATEEVQKPFTLDQWPLLRVTLLQLDDTEYLLLLTIHHIVADGWSMGILVREVATLYEAFCAGERSPLKRLSIQYVDYAVWQRQWLQGEVLETKLSYWKQQLGHNLPTLQLPTKPNSTVSHSQSAIHEFQFSPQLSAALNKLSRQESVTLFMTLLAAFQTLLYRYTNQDDITVGTDLANRTQSETEQLIGFFVNLLVLRTDMSGNPTFYELLERVREVTLKAYAHQDLPFEKLVAELRPERSLSQTPLFQVLFVMQNAPMPTLEVSGLTLSPWEIENETAKFDLAVFIGETEDQITGSWKYNADLFDAATITKMSNHFETLLASIVKQPDARLNTLEMLTETEKQQQAMEEIKREKSNFSKFKSIKPKAIRLSEKELIETEYLQPGQTLPLVIKPVADDIDLVDWVKSSGALIESKLLQHGAILFRGFNLKSVSEFERVTSAICPQLFANYGDLPKEGISDRVYSSTPYPCDQAILFHNESSHLHQWPLKIWFFCLQPAQQGGETPIVDCNKVYQLLDPKLRERFEQKQLMYVRNYIEGLDVSWQNFFHTDDKIVVEKACRQSGIDFEWLPNNGLRTRKVRPAISHHPQTAKSVFFNQVQLHHISCLESDVRESLLSTLREENLPRNVYYGDGSPIEDSVMAEIEAVYQQAKVSFPWQQGDILMLDNMLIAHGRNPYKGSRKIVVAMGEMISSTNS